jgi:hypothetical protein
LVICAFRRQQLVARHEESNVNEERSERTRRGDDRVLIARIAAAERWGRTRDRTAATEPARRGLRAQDRARRADQLMQAHMLRMSRAAAQARLRAAR